MLTTIHDTLHRGYGRPKRDLAAMILRRNARSSVGVVTVSEYARASLCGALALDPARVFTVHHGVHAEASLPPLAQAHSPYLLYVGNAKPHKNVELLIDWSQQILPVHGLRLILVVPEADRRHLGQHIAARADVEILSGLPEPRLRELLRGAQLYISLAEGEGFGLPPLEAAGGGVPSVLIDAGAHREVMLTGARYFSHDIDDFSDAVAGALADHDLLRRAAWERAREMNWLRSWRSLRSIYEQYVDVVI